jgi:AcrR family transcriptional regulator
LPPGRHGLSRSYVAQNQRQRIIAAVAHVCATEGYFKMSVEDVLAEAGVSRRTFYEHFKNKEHVFLAAYDDVAGGLLHRVTGAVDSGEGFSDRVRAGLSSFLGYLAGAPEFARMCIVEVLAAGPEAVARRDAAMRGFAELIQANAAELLPEAPSVSPLVAEMIVGGIYEVVYTRIVRGEVSKLPELVPDLVYSVLLPYMGADAAAAELQASASRR